MRAFKTLRDFLELLETDKQLLRITDAVSPEPDLAAAGRAINQAGGETSPALLFNNIKGFAKAEVVMNAHGSWPNLALMLGMEKDASLTQQFFEFVRRYRLFPGKMDHRTSAPWQEVVIENDINLFSLLPLFRLGSIRATAVSTSTKPASSAVISTTGTTRTYRTSACIAYR